MPIMLQHLHIEWSIQVSNDLLHLLVSTQGMKNNIYD